MLRVKLEITFAAALFLILSSVSFESALAQEPAVLYGVFPQRGSLGTEVNMVLSGDGFESLSELTNVLISGQEIPVLDYEVISNTAIRIFFVIPEQTPSGETEISFIFGEFGLDAYFEVRERSDENIAPVIRQMDPQGGQVDTEMALFFQGAGLFELGEPGVVIIAGVEVPVIDYAIESERSMLLAIYIPPETPIGETEIGLFFENYSYLDFFRVSGPERVEPEPPRLLGLDPHEGLVDTEMELALEGEGFFGLGEPLEVSIDNIEVPILGYGIESSNFMVIAIYLPPELPRGETRIAFFFENATFEDFFLVRGHEPIPVEPEPPRLTELNPQDGQADSEIELFLEGENLFDLGELLGVNIGGFEIDVQDYDIQTNEAIVVNVYLPDETPRGSQIISFFFENAGFEAPFTVHAPTRREFPTTVIVVIIVVVGVGVLAGQRLIRDRKPAEEKPEDEPEKPKAKIEIEVELDEGTQSVELAEPTQKMVLDLQIEAQIDEGEQWVELDGDSIISSED